MLHNVAAGSNYEGQNPSGSMWSNMFKNNMVGTLAKGFVGAGPEGGIMSMAHRKANEEAKLLNSRTDIYQTYSDSNGNTFGGLEYAGQDGFVRRLDKQGRRRMYDVSLIEELARAKEQREIFMSEVIKLYLVDDNATAHLLGLSLNDWLALAKSNGTAPASLGTDRAKVLTDMEPTLKRHNCTISVIHQHSLDARVSTLAIGKLKYIIETIGVPEFVNMSVPAAGGWVPSQGGAAEHSGGRKIGHGTLAGTGGTGPADGPANAFP